IPTQISRIGDDQFRHRFRASLENLFRGLDSPPWIEAYFGSHPQHGCTDEGDRENGGHPGKVQSPSHWPIRTCALGTLRSATSCHVRVSRNAACTAAISAP